MEKKSKRKFVAPELLSVSAGPDGTPLHAMCSSGSGDFDFCSNVGTTADTCEGSGTGAFPSCFGTGGTAFP